MINKYITYICNLHMYSLFYYIICQSRNTNNIMCRSHKH